jgi:transcriptional/translational regulatory protein YebC/TACO1
VKAGGKMADSGSVMFNFRRAAQVLVRANGTSEEQVRAQSGTAEKALQMEC